MNTGKDKCTNTYQTGQRRATGGNKGTAAGTKVFEIHVMYIILGSKRKAVIERLGNSLNTKRRI